MSKKILAFGTSTSKNSINRAFAKTIANELSENYELVDLSDYEVEIYSVDREESKGVPKKIVELFNKIKLSDIVVVSNAEHNGSYPAAYKNIIDWMSRIDQGFFQGKDVILLSASIGELGASNVLSQSIDSLKFFNGNLVKAYSIGGVSEDMIVNGFLNVSKDIKDQLLESIKRNI